MSLAGQYESLLKEKAAEEIEFFFYHPTLTLSLDAWIATVRKMQQ